MMHPLKRGVFLNGNSINNAGMCNLNRDDERV